MDKRSMARFRLVALFSAVVLLCTAKAESEEIEDINRGIIDAITNGVEGIIQNIIDKVNDIANSTGLQTLVDNIEERIETIVTSLREHVQHLMEQIKNDIESAAEIMDEKIKPCIQAQSIVVQGLEMKFKGGFKKCANETKGRIEEAKSVVENLLEKLDRVKQEALNIKATCKQAGGIIDTTKCAIQGLQTLTSKLTELSIEIAKSVNELRITGQNTIKEVTKCAVKVQVEAIKDINVVKNNIVRCIST